MAAYPSGLRGRFAKPLFVGSNPTAACRSIAEIPACRWLGSGTSRSAAETPEILHLESIIYRSAAILFSIRRHGDVTSLRGRLAEAIFSQSASNNPSEAAPHFLFLHFNFLFSSVAHIFVVFSCF
jgi:hypothetical protein